MLNKNILIKEVKLHPFVAQKILMHMKNFNTQELKNIYQRLLDIDIKLKTGGINISGGNEKALALELEKILLKF